MQQSEGNVEDMSFRGKMLAKSAVSLIYFTASFEGKDVYIYMGVPATMLSDFNKARAGESFAPGKFGKIVEWGYGEPTNATKALMESRYGFKHDNAMDMFPSTEITFDVVDAE